MSHFLLGTASGHFYLVEHKQSGVNSEVISMFCTDMALSHQNLGLFLPQPQETQKNIFRRTGKKIQRSQTCSE